MDETNQKVGVGRHGDFVMEELVRVAGERGALFYALWRKVWV